jgi:hypothetical protein
MYEINYTTWSKYARAVRPSDPCPRCCPIGAVNAGTFVPSSEGTVWMNA